ncbi:hypothetical protein [Methanocaldococcus sp.]
MKRSPNKDIHEIINFLKSLPEGRKIYIEMSGIWVEVSREEAINFLKKKENENESCK